MAQQQLNKWNQQLKKNCKKDEEMPFWWIFCENLVQAFSAPQTLDT